MALAPGRYLARIEDYGFTTPKDPTKNPSARVSFKVKVKEKQRNAVGGFNEVERDEKISWTGSFNGGARQYTVKALVEVFGFAGKTGSELLRGMGSMMLNENQDYEIDVIEEEFNGKLYKKVGRVFVAGKAPGAKLGQEGAALVDAMDLENDFALARDLASDNAEGKAAFGETPQKPTMKMDAPPAWDSDETVPF